MTDLAFARAERDVSAAQRRAERIRVGMHSFIATRKEIAAAYAERDWVTLAYDSFEAYVESEFSEGRLRLSPDERREAVAELRRAGMSTRAIGAVVGASKDTVARDLATVSDETVPDRITGTDGREQPASRPKPAPAETPGPAAVSPSVAAGPGSASGAPSPAPEPHPNWPTEAELKPWESLDPMADRVAESMEPETCLGADMDCGRPLPCPNHPRTPEERIAAVAEVAPEFVQPVEVAAKPTLTLVPGEDEKRAAKQRDARALLRRVIELLSPTNGKPDYLETWARQLGPYDEELVELVHRANDALAALDDLISEAGK